MDLTVITTLKRAKARSTSLRSHYRESAFVARTKQLRTLTRFATQKNDSSGKSSSQDPPSEETELANVAAASRDRLQSLGESFLVHSGLSVVMHGRGWIKDRQKGIPKGMDIE